MTAKGGWPRASSKTRSMVPAEAARESNSEADGKTGRAGEIQPAIRQKLSLAGELPAVLNLPVSRLGQSVLPRMVYQEDAGEDRTDEESGSYASQPRGPDPELVQVPRNDFSRCRGRSEQ
jgi:hypothetical protein